MTAQLERLAAAGIELVPSLAAPQYFVFMRDGFVSLVERKDGGFGAAGSPALLTEHGLAMLVWRGEQGFFVAKGHEQPAAAAQVAALRRFAADLAAALA